MKIKLLLRKFSTLRQMKSKQNKAKSSNKNTRSPLRKALFIAAFAVVAVGAFAAYQYYTYVAPNFHCSTETHLYITPDTSFDDIVQQLTDKQVVRNPRSFVRWAKLKKYPNNIKTGCYEVKDGMSNKQLLNLLLRKIQSPIKLTINNIRTLPQLSSRLAKQLMHDSTAFMQCFTDPNTLLEYNIKQEEIIAFFIPNTYEVYWDTKPQDLVKRMHIEFKRFWTDARLEKAKACQLSPIEVITLASIVEEETRLKKDKPIIAGLYINRLRKRIPLQACPTAKYASGDFTLRRILLEHTQIDSPYNTYRNLGLPPGPIRTPSIESIDAVLNYEKSNYLYMCAKETRNGEHYFAATYAEHLRNAKKYQAAFKKK